MIINKNKVAPIIWSDLDPALTPDVQAGLKLDVNVEAVKGSIDNIIRTSPGERIFLPQFALGMRNLLFEPINSTLLNRFANQIKDAVEIWDPRVNVAGVDFQEDTDNNFISLTVKFNIAGYTQTFSTSTTIVQ
jgi:uncharacterized protein